ncbi:MAG: tRNA 2-selenouridine(34) synthase MnmH [Planctomycetota bacterium]|nr:tRNA 2-selenouridine(34) synthase MnmH [Planctomycetota bacterium]
MSAGTKNHQVPSAGVHQVLEALESEDPPVVIDLRTPKEYAQDHLPGAVNLPIFRNEERALVGTLYKRESPDRAFEVGRELVAERIVTLFEGIAEAASWDLPEVDLPARVLEMTSEGIAGLEGGLVEVLAEALPERPVIFHCWRGGLRSRSVVALLAVCGFDRALCLSGGYTQYRRRVITELEAFEAPGMVVIRGFTGTGKTLVLRTLEELRPNSTLDLEEFAGHRSSILGMVGLEPVSQKRFESRLATRLRRLGRLNPGGRLVVEGESRKIGDRIQPASVWQGLQAGINVQLVADLERRVDVLIEDYLDRDGSRAELRTQLPFIEKRLGPVAWKGRLTGLLDAGEDRELVRTLLEHYYDPLYTHSERGHDYAQTIEMQDPQQAAAELAGFLDGLSD